MEELKLQWLEGMENIKLTRAIETPSMSLKSFK